MFTGLAHMWMRVGAAQGASACSESQGSQVAVPWAMLGPAACFLLKPEQVLQCLMGCFFSPVMPKYLCWPVLPLGGPWDPC